MDILETNVKHNTEDIRELKRRVTKNENDVSDLKTNQQVTQNSLYSLIESLNKMDRKIEDMDKKQDEDRKERTQAEIENLKSYKSLIWKVAGVIIAAIILVQFGLQ